MSENCKGRNYYEIMARAQALADARNRVRTEADMKRIMQQPDRRKVGFGAPQNGETAS